MGWMELLKPVLAMLAFDALFAVMTALIKTAMADGLNRLVLITLRQLVATIFLAPIAYFKEREARPKFTREIFVYMFLSSLLGAALSQYLFFLGLNYTTATLAATLCNITPVLTFLIAVPLRLEVLDAKSKAGLAKIIGTLTSLSGAMLLSLYKGVALTKASSSQELSSNHDHGHIVDDHSNKKWMLGSAALLANCISFSFWMLLQGKLTKKYPAIYSSTTFMALFSSLQAGALALATQRRFSVWVLKGSVKITAVIFAGVGVSGIGYVLMTWCIEKRGPVLTAAFTPFIQIMAAGIDFFILHEQLYLGSAVGAILVIGGLYLLLWGKNEEATTVCSLKGADEDREQQVKL